MQNKTTEKKTFTEADYLYPTGFNVSFRARCYVTVQVGAFTKAEAVAKVEAMLSLWEKRYGKDSERILGVPSFEDTQGVSIEMTHITNEDRKHLYAERVYLTEEIIRDYLLPDEAYWNEKSGDNTPTERTSENHV